MVRVVIPAGGDNDPYVALWINGRDFSQQVDTEFDPATAVLDALRQSHLADDLVEVSSGEAPGWLPAWADSGVDYTAGEAYFGGVSITNLVEIHAATGTVQGGGLFDPAAVTAAGMEFTTAGVNRPCAAGDFLARMAALDFTFFVEFSLTGASPVTATGVVMLLTDVDGTSGGLAVEWGVGNMNVTDFNNGEFATVGTVLVSTTHRLCGSNTAGGWLSSLDGGSAVLDAPQSVEVVDQATLGFESPAGAGTNAIEGHIRRIFFGPAGKSAGQVEAIAA
jgi:hypothetical protein